jgi:hypothetical protein
MMIWKMIVKKMTVTTRKRDEKAKKMSQKQLHSSSQLFQEKYLFLVE